MRVLGEGGYGSVVALDPHRVVKLQGADKDGRAGISAAALREMVALRVLDRKAMVGRMLVHRSGTVGIEIRRFPQSLLDWLRANKRRARVGSGERVSGATPASVLRLVADLASELATAHAHGYIHRDVKPENVMLDASGRAHLIDWGLSRFVPAAAPGRWTPGVATLWYRAPELFTGDAYGGAVDIWSLGVLLVELVTGTCPFRGRTEIDQLSHYVDVLGPPPRRADCLPHWPLSRDASRHEPSRAQDVWNLVGGVAAVPGLADLIDRMVRWDPASRIAAQDVLLHPAVQPFVAAGSALPPRPVRFSVPLPPLSDVSALRVAIRRVIFPGCLALGMPLLPVAWCAARFYWRVLAAQKQGRGGSLKFAPLLCLDLAAKIVGTQLARSLVRSRSLTRRQVDLVNHFLGVPGLADGTEQSCAPLAALESLPSFGAPISPAARLWMRLLLEAALLAAPERILPNRSWPLPVAALRHLAVYLLTGLNDELVRCRAAARRFSRSQPSSLATPVLRGFVRGADLLLAGRPKGKNAPISAHAPPAAFLDLWRRTRPRYAALLDDLDRDPVRRRRLAQGLAAMTSRI